MTQILTKRKLWNTLVASSPTKPKDEGGKTLGNRKRTVALGLIAISVAFLLVIASFWVVPFGTHVSKSAALGSSSNSYDQIEILRASRHQGPVAIPSSPATFYPARSADVFLGQQASRHVGTAQIESLQLAGYLPTFVVVQPPAITTLWGLAKPGPYVVSSNGVSAGF